MKYSLSRDYDITVRQIDNGFMVVISNPDSPNTTQMFFAAELDAYEYAAKILADVIEGIKNGKN